MGDTHLCFIADDTFRIWCDADPRIETIHDASMIVNATMSVERVTCVECLRKALISNPSIQRAEHVIVTSDGRTLLPDAMVAELGLRIWFLKGRERWEAWSETELEELFKERLP